MKPILFNTEMVQAILEGRKSVTRRAIKLDLGLADTDKNDSSWLKIPDEYGDCHDAKDLCRYKVGDILYVREKFNDIETDSVLYAADKEFIGLGCKEVDGYLFMESEIKWKPSIHMPKDMARIFLKVTDVRVERLGDMNVNDFLREGVEPTYGCKNAIELVSIHAKKFKELWNNTYGDWDANSYVWVIEFEREV